MDQALLKNATHEVHNSQLPGHEDRGYEIMAVCIAATVVIGLLVPLRLIVRTAMVKWIGSDDCMIVLAAVCLEVSHSQNFGLNTLLGQR